MDNQSEECGRTAEVTFGPLKRALREHQYPVSSGELIEQYGGFELETPSGSEPLESVLHRCAESTFTEPWHVRDAVLEATGANAVTASDGSDASSQKKRARNGSEADDRRNEPDPDGGDVSDWSQLSI